MNMKKLILTNLPYVLFVYPFDKVRRKEVGRLDVRQPNFAD